MNEASRKVILVASAAILSGCISLPLSEFEWTVSDLGFESRVVRGKDFNHLILSNRRFFPPVSRLHIYIGGDGTPWLGPGRPSRDPTPRTPLVLKLMALDSVPALYLGRPCYAGVFDVGTCHPWFWTHGRYSEQVVASMNSALRRIVAEQQIRRLTLIGYSGGGALAMLVAERLPEVDSVVTLAGNLNVGRWAEMHEYSPLTGSLDPVVRGPLAPGIVQWHFVGDQDRNVPPELVRDAVSNQPSARVSVLSNTDHRCCWERLWSDLLDKIESGRNVPERQERGQKKSAGS